MQHSPRNTLKALVFVALGLVVLGILATGGALWAAPSAQNGCGSVGPCPPTPVPLPGVQCCLPGLAFTSNRDGNEEIYVMELDGSQFLRITNNPASDRQPAPSMDGTRIAFASNRDEPNQFYHIYTMDVDGANVRRLTNGPGQDMNPIWATASNRIAFVSTRDDPNPLTCGTTGQPACITNIYVMNPDGSGVTRLTNNSPTNRYSVSDPNWSPVSTRIAFVWNRDGNDEIYAMDADGGNLTRLTNNSAADGHPAWSPDGTRIAFETNRGGNYQVFTMNADGSNQVLVPMPLDSTAQDRRPIWLPGCIERIVFASNRGDHQRFLVYAVDPDGKNLSRLTELGATPVSTSTTAGMIDRDDFPAWSGLPSTMRVAGSCCVPAIAFDSTRDTKRDGNEQIYIMRVDGSWLTRLTYSAASDRRPAPSPDGTRISFESNRNGLYQIWMMNTDGFGQRSITSSRGNDIQPHWSNDGARLAFVSTRDDPNPATCGQVGKPPCAEHIYTMKPDGSDVFRLTTNPLTNTLAANENPTWSADSKRLAFQSTRDDPDASTCGQAGKPACISHVYLINADGTGLQLMPNSSTNDSHPFFSPEGTRLAFESMRSGKWQIYVQNVDGTNLKQVTDDAKQQGENRRPYWCPTCVDRIVFASNRDSTTYNICTMRSDGSNQACVSAKNPDDNPAWSGLPIRWPGTTMLDITGRRLYAWLYGFDR